MCLQQKSNVYFNVTFAKWNLIIVCTNNEDEIASTPHMRATNASTSVAFDNILNVFRKFQKSNWYNFSSLHATQKDTAVVIHTGLLSRKIRNVYDHAININCRYFSMKMNRSSCQLRESKTKSSGRRSNFRASWIKLQLHWSGQS